MATETISVSFRQYLSNMSGKLSIKNPQIGAMLGTVHYFRNTNVKVKIIQNEK